MSRVGKGTNGSGKAGVLGTLRQLLSSRRPRLRVTFRPRAPTALAAPAASSPGADTAVIGDLLAPTSQNNSSLVTRAKELEQHASLTPQALLPAPPRVPDESDDSDDASASDDSGDDGHADGSQQQQPPPSSDSNVKKKTKKKPKNDKRKRTNSTWVAKLLNQAAPPRDRVHTLKKKTRPHAAASSSSSTLCHAVLRVTSAFHATLLARVFDFLAPVEIAKRCALVNRAVAYSVTQYYARHCAWPRPRAFLAYTLFSARHAERRFASTSTRPDLLTRALAMLPIRDRVRASATSHAFRSAADGLPLEFTCPRDAAQFLETFPLRRVAQRYAKTTQLRIDSVTPSDAVRLLQLLSNDDDDDDDNDNDDHDVVAVAGIALSRLGGFDTEHQFVALVQSLFCDRVSQTLRVLSLSDLALTDANFRQLARLLYDGQFPRLAALDLSRNLFPSRFMRDWARSFREDRFVGLTRLDITGVRMGVDDMIRFFECLRHVPMLRELEVSHNYCSVASMHVLADVLTDSCLCRLEELGCSAVSASDHAVHILLDALHTPGVCAALRSLDISGNDLSAGDQTMQSLADAFLTASWPQLQCLNLSFTMPSSRGFQLLTQGLMRGPHRTLRELHVAGNALDGDAFESLVLAMDAGSLRRVELLNLSDNNMAALEFELLAHSLSEDACPRLQTLLLSANAARADGITRFCQFFRSRVAQTIHTLDLSGNALPSHALDMVADELRDRRSLQLQILNLSRNMAPRSVVRFQQLIRSNACPSLACVQVGYAQSETQGYEFVRTVRSTMSVDELRRLKQLQFEAHVERIQHENVAEAARATARCKRQTKLLREMYDHMESEADRALRRRKRMRKSPHLHIHQEIQTLKQAKYQEKVCRDLERALRSAPLT